MTTQEQFRAKAKMRHDFSDQIQVRYDHPNGESFDTWISGEEVMRRLDTKSRERVIRSLARKNWRELRDAGSEIIDEAQERARRGLRDRLADAVSDTLGDHVIGDTLSDRVRGADSEADPYQREKEVWQARLTDASFRAVALELAWINLDGTLPEEGSEVVDDWL